MDYILSFKVSQDRLSLFVDLLTGEGIQLSVKAASASEAKPIAKPTISRSGKHLPQIIFEAMESPKTMEQIKEIVAQTGFNLNSATPSISRLRAAGFITKDDRGRWTRVPGVAFNPIAIKQTKGPQS